MFVLQKYKINAELREQSEVEQIIGGTVHLGAKMLLRAMRKAAADCANLWQLPLSDLRRVMGFFPISSSSSLIGEIFFIPGEAGAPVHLFVFQPTASYLEIWEIRHHQSKSRIETFRSVIEKSAQSNLDGRRLRAMQFELIEIPLTQKSSGPIIWNQPSKKEPQLKKKNPDYFEQEIKATEVLIEEQARSIALNLARNSKMRTADLEFENTYLEDLTKNGIIKSEFLVICKKDSRTLCQVDNREQLVLNRSGSLKCAICGRSFAEERIEEISALTDFGKKLLNSSRWMSIWVTETLVDCGVDPSQIFWNATVGEDELDILIDAFGRRIIFELKDREFGVGDAYPFVTRLNRYAGSYGVVVTTDKIAQAAQDFLNESMQSNKDLHLQVIQGANLKQGIEQFIEKCSRETILGYIAELEDRLGFPLKGVVSTWVRNTPKMTGVSQR